MRQGQVGLMLLVIMAVVVALVMSLASRSLSDTMLSRQENESSAAFSIAETGIEQALNTLRRGTVPTGVITIADSTGLIAGNYEVVAENSLGLYLEEGEVAHLDLSSFGGGNLGIKWTRINDPSEDIATCTEGSETMPAGMEVVALNVDEVAVGRSYYNPSNCDIATNGFGASSDGGTGYRSAKTYVVPANTAAIRLRPIYAGATISITGAGLTEEQMYVIQSSGSGGDAQKEIEVKRGLDAPAGIFDYVLFSGETIVK